MAIWQPMETCLVDLAGGVPGISWVEAKGAAEGPRTAPHGRGSVEKGGGSLWSPITKRPTSFQEHGAQCHQMKTGEPYRHQHVFFYKDCSTSFFKKIDISPPPPSLMLASEPLAAKHQGNMDSRQAATLCRKEARGWASFQKKTRSLKR